MITTRPLMSPELDYVLRLIDDPQVQQAVALRWQVTGLNLGCWQDDELIAVGGIQIIHPGVGDAWFCLISETPPALALVREVRKAINQLKTVLQLHRIEALVRDKAPGQAERFAQIMGLRYESTKRRFGTDGVDYHMYAWVTDEP